MAAAARELVASGAERSLQVAAYVPGVPPGTTAATVSDRATAAFGRDPRILAADIPAGAKVSALLYAGWFGDVDGARLVSPELAAAATAESSAGVDREYGDDSRWAMLSALGLPWDEAGSPRVFGMAGAGGSRAGADPERGVAVTKNVLSADLDTA